MAEGFLQGLTCIPFLPRLIQLQNPMKNASNLESNDFSCVFLVETSECLHPRLREHRYPFPTFSYHSRRRTCHILARLESRHMERNPDFLERLLATLEQIRWSLFIFT